MKTKTVLIEIRLDKDITKSDLDLRNLLVETIESRNLGEVIEETSSPSMLEIVIEISREKKINDNLRDLLISLGFNDYNLRDISIDEG